MLKRSLLAGVALLALAGPATAELMASGNDTKAVLVDGVNTVVANPAPETVTVYDLASTPPRLVATVAAPNSVTGPPFSVAFTPDERLLLVSSNQKIDPANPARTIADNRLSVIDLQASPPAVVQTLETGAGPAGISVNRAGTLALVAYREAGMVGVFRIRNARLEPVGTVEIAAPASGVSHVAITPDGRHALVTRDGDFFLTVLAIEGETVTRTARTFSAGLRPYGVVIGPDGRFGVVANIGRGNGDEDTVSMIDMRGAPATWRVVETISVGQTPESLQLSPDGRVLAVVVVGGSNKPANSPFLGQGVVRTYRVEGLRLVPAGEAPIGAWAQGAVFSADGRRLFAQSMVDRNIRSYAVAADGSIQESGAPIALPGGGAALRTADR
jgi:DNA-binding beta-propeller fold protein YncE